MRILTNAVVSTALFFGLSACSQTSAPSASGNTEASSPPASVDGQTLTQARARFATRLIRQERDGSPPPTPPADRYALIRYPAAGGEFSAYLTPRPETPGKHPAIIWMTGGDSNTIGDVWSPQPRENDQSAAAFGNAGIVAMFPSLRGGNDNPGVREAFYGEVQDILAAADYLATLDYVDPQRIYLGGHSTGGTLVLLVAQTDARFRATFAFGPVYDVAGYGHDMLPVVVEDTNEIRLRSPGYWLSSIRSPVYIFEGDHDGNTHDLERLRAESRNPNIHAFVVPGADHFSTLAPLNERIAQKILADSSGAADFSFGEADVVEAMR